MDKTKALSAALSQIERQFGKGSVMKLGKNDRSMDIETISSGSLGLDIALGVGGLPKGRVVEIYGPESSGKTTLALHCAAEAQKKGGICAFIDAEHALDPVYARKLGVNVDELLISQPDHGEQALEIADTLVRSGAVDVLIVDSVAALVPRAELEGEMGDALPGLQARLMSQALRKLTASINKSNTMVIFINQIRMKRIVAASAQCLASTATAFGPCSATSARSASGSMMQASESCARSSASSSALQAALTTRNRWSPKFATIRSSRMPPSSLVNWA